MRHVATVFLMFGLAAAQDSALTRRYGQIQYQGGDVVVGPALAKLALGDRFKYTGPEDASFILENLWGNPPGGKTLGMVFPRESGPMDSGGWAIVVSYEEDGHVKDDDAASINYDDMLKQLQKSILENNKERAKHGYAPMELVGWAEKPYYDAGAKKLYWAKEIRFGQSRDNTLNYNIRVLGRKGVLVLNVVASMGALPRVKTDMVEILKRVDFLPGNHYADFKPGMDPMAKYGIAALVAGGILAKVGFFKGLLLGILALKKFLIIGVIALAALVRKFFKNRTPEVRKPEEIVKKIE